MIIVNSDDFGLSDSVNLATKNAFERMLISSTTLIVNMEGYNSALQMIKKKYVKKDSVGIHVNLQEGFPITDEIKNLNICNSNGEFNYSFRNNSHFFKDKLFLSIVKDEINAQINKFKNDLKSTPTHLDSHDHTHNEFFMIKIISELISDHSINYYRPPRNIGEIKLHKILYKKIYRHYAKRCGLKSVDYFGNIIDFQNIKINNQKNYELEVHCMFKDNILTDSGISFESKLFDFKRNKNLKNYNLLSKNI